jgi:AcrR family transcriptional regulator
MNPSRHHPAYGRIRSCRRLTKLPVCGNAKNQDCQTIRREAFRLIEENGYAATTVEQIAEAAEVSPSTLFRYFPTKESVLLADDMDPVILNALDEQPPELSPSQAVRRAYQAVMANLSDDQREFENTRAQGGHVRRVLPHHHHVRRGNQRPNRP